MVVTSTGAAMEISRLIQRSMDWVLGRNDLGRVVAVRQEDPARFCDYGHAVFSGNNLCGYGHHAARAIQARALP